MSLIVLPVTSVPTIPGVRALNHPAFRQRCEAFCALWARLEFEAPLRTMLGHPRVEVVIVIFHIRKDRAQTRKIVRGDVPEQLRSRCAIIEAGTGNQDGNQQSQRIDQEMPLAPFDFLAPIIPSLGATHLGGLHRLALDADSARCGLAPCFYTGLLT